MMKPGTVVVTDREREILRHALGLDRARVSYRNTFSAAPRSEDYLTCMDLRAKGLMERSGVYAETMIHFHVTEAGKALVLG